MKRLLKFALFSILLLFSVSIIRAQEEDPDEIAKKHGVTFPIVELDSCKDYNECRNFCEDPINADTCIAFAKSKGFYKEDAISTKKEEILVKAKSEFGCDSHDSCKSFCAKPENFDKCDAFARNNDLIGGHINDTREGKFIEKAKEVLGCQSASSCSNFCDNPANHQKCSDFARQLGLRGGEKMTGPGGCTSEETCKAFCSDPVNYQVCHSFSSAYGSKFVGPGGCDSEESCRNYCQSNPRNCVSTASERREGGGNDPQETCSRSPSCAWVENICQCGFYGKYEDTIKKAQEYAEYCRKNPDKCGQGMMGGFDSTQVRQQFEDYCRNNPSACRYTSTHDPAAECARYSGCSWSGSSCNCSGPVPTGGNMNDMTPEAACARSGSGCYWATNYCKCPSSGSGGQTPWPYQAPWPYSTGGGAYATPYPYNKGSYDPATECAKHSGCSWTGTWCQCSPSSTSAGGSTSQPSQTQAPTEQQTQTMDPATACSQTAGCSWNGSSCQCSSVQGVATVFVKTWYDQLVDFLEGLLGK